MELRFKIDADLSPERIAEYAKLLNEMLGIDGEWEIRTETAQKRLAPTEINVNEQRTYGDGETNKTA